MLLNPGPVNLSQRVRQALTGPDLCHREVEFSALQKRLQEDLLALYSLDPEEYAAVLLAGSGTGAVEAMLCSLIPTGGRVLILDNGVYGQRLGRIAAIHGIPHDILRHAWDEPLAIQQVRSRLHEESGISHLAVVHHETTTGRLNDLAALAEPCRERGIAMLVDAVSSFGAEDIDFAHWPLAATAASANKCLHGVPGLSFVLLRRAALEGRTTAARSLYLDLRNYLTAQDAQDTPFTPPVQCCYALAEALAECRETGGWPARHRSYWQKMDRVRGGLADLGVAPLLSRAQCAAALNAFRLPAGMAYQPLHDALKEAGYIIYAGQGDLTRTIFRIACMGEVSMEQLAAFLSAVGDILKSQ